jgi:hypothetical protein
MEHWEKKLRNAIRTEIRGLVNEGKLDLSIIAENLELDVSELLDEAHEDSAAAAVDVNVQPDGGMHVSIRASEEAAEEGDVHTQQSAVDAFGDEEESETDSDDFDAEDQIVSERWQRLAGILRD